MRRRVKPGSDVRVKYGIDLAWSYLVGDRWRDVTPAACRTIFVDYGYPQGPTR
jgi:histidinol phosphatase-like enzyme